MLVHSFTCMHALARSSPARPAAHGCAGGAPRCGHPCTRAPSQKRQAPLRVPASLPRLRPEALDTGSQGPARGFIYKRGRAAAVGQWGPHPIQVCTRRARCPQGPPPPAPRLGGARPRGGPLSSLGGDDGVLEAFGGPGWGRGQPGWGRGHKRPKCHRQTASRAGTAACPQRRAGRS